MTVVLLSAAGPAKGWMGWLRSSDVADPLSTCSRIKMFIDWISQSIKLSVNPSLSVSNNAAIKQTEKLLLKYCKAVRSNAGIQEELD